MEGNGHIQPQNVLTLQEKRVTEYKEQWFNRIVFLMCYLNMYKKGL